MKENKFESIKSCHYSPAAGYYKATGCYKRRKNWLVIMVLQVKAFLSFKQIFTTDIASNKKWMFILSDGLKRSRYFHSADNPSTILFPLFSGLDAPFTFTHLKIIIKYLIDEI